MECQFCHQGQEAEDVCGTLHSVENELCYCVAHQRCMQYSSKLTQFQFDWFGGFYIDHVEKEIKRGMKLRCHICKRKGATVGCSYEKCNKTYHFPCAKKCKDVHVLRFRKCDSQDANQRLLLFRVFCSDSHKCIYMKNSNLVNADCDYELSLNGINEDMECENADDSVESNGTPDIDETINYDLGGSGALSSAFFVGEDAVDVDPVPTSATDENANSLRFATSVQQTSTETSYEMISAAKSNCTMALVDAAGVVTATNAAISGTSTIVATCAEASPSEATITFSPFCVTEDDTVCKNVIGSTGEIANSFVFNCMDLSQSQSRTRRDRLSLRSTQKRRREEQANEEVLCSRSPSRAAEVADSSLAQVDPESDKIVNASIAGTGEEMDFDGLPDPFAESPKMKSDGKNESVSTPSLRKVSHQKVSISRRQSKKSGLDHSQRLITSMLSPVRKSLNFDMEAPLPMEGQKETSSTADSLNISSANDNFQFHFPVDDVLTNSLQHIQSVLTADGVEDPKSTVSFIRLDCYQETQNANVPRAVLKVFEIRKTTDMVALFEDDDSCNSSLQDWDTHSIDLLDLIGKNDSSRGSDDSNDDSDDVDDDGGCNDVFEVLRSNYTESFTFTFCQEDDMEIDQVCAICIPVSGEPFDEKTSCILLKHAIRKLDLVEENVFSWQMDDCKKIEFLNTILQCSEYLREKNDKKLMEKLFNNSQFEALLDPQDGDSTNKQFVEMILSAISENFNIAKQKYGTFMGGLFGDQSSNIQAAFIILNKLNDRMLTARSCLPRSRVHVCNENTGFTVPFSFSEAQKSMILDREYKNLKWCLENWFDYSTILIYPNDSELRIQSTSSLSNCIGIFFKQHVVPGGSTYFVFIYRTDPLINYRLFVCKMLAFVKEELLTLNHDVCIVFDVGSEVEITRLSDVVTSSFSESSVGCCIDVQVFTGVNPKYSPISCLLIHLSLQIYSTSKGFLHE